MDVLRESWRRVTAERDHRDEFIDLVCRYSDSARRYHNLEHIRDMLQDLLATDRNENAALHRAIWWHDSLYDTTRHDNEERSAELAAQTLASWEEPEPAIERVRALILVTKHHHATPGDMDAELLIDLDLSILAAWPERYDLYAVNVREEYGWLTDAEFRQGRSEFLKRMLTRERLFTILGAEAEIQARANIERELARLIKQEVGSRQ